MFLPKLASVSEHLCSTTSLATRSGICDHSPAMNQRQKNLTWVALGAFVLTLVAAPWEITDYAAFDNSGSSGIPHISRKAYAPIWSPPANTYGKSEVQVSMLFVEWVAVGVVYFVVSALLKDGTKTSG
jgi:hypothetical protein